jgi:carboxymethylenebutenolidase
MLVAARPGTAHDRDMVPASALAHVARPSGTGLPVLIIHSWWGLTSSFPEYADHLAAHGFLVGCVDLYGGRLASTPAEAAALRSAPRRESMSHLMIRAVADLVADPQAAPGGVGLVGFSMGGHWAVWLAQRAEVGCRAVVVHYATRAVTKGAPVPVLIHFAESDPFVSLSGRRAMDRSLDRLGWPHRAHEYPGTGHWFAESASDAYDAPAAALALTRTVSFLRNPA